MKVAFLRRVGCSLPTGRFNPDKPTCGEAVHQSSWVTGYPAAYSFPMRLLFSNQPAPPVSMTASGNVRLPSQLAGLTSVKTLDGQAVSVPPAIFFIGKLRNYLEGFGFQSAIAIVLHRLVATNVVDSTSVWSPYGQTCHNTSGACYRRGGRPNYRLVLRRHRIPSRGN